MSITIFGTSNCVDCQKAKMLCEMKLLDFSYQEVGVDITQQELAKKVGQDVRSVPQIFNDGECIGGYEALRRLVA